MSFFVLWVAVLEYAQQETVIGIKNSEELLPGQKEKSSY